MAAVEHNAITMAAIENKIFFICKITFIFEAKLQIKIIIS